eukprot:gene6364-biopygen8162
MYHVEWAPRCEPLDIVEAVGTEAAKAQLDMLLAHRTTKQQTSTASKTHKAAPAQSNPTPPNCYLSGQTYDITIGQSVRKQLVIHPLPINPHADIPPTGSRGVTTRKIPLIDQNSTQDPACPQSWIERACIHHADGRCTHIVDMDTAAQLRARFQHVQQQHPGQLEKLKAKSFEEEMHCLLQRYTSGNIMAKKKIAVRDQQALPHNLHVVLHSLIGSTTERFASPLNVSMNTSRYWSLHKRDTLFGANWDAYPVKWTGASVAVPEHTDSSAFAGS